MPDWAANLSWWTLLDFYIFFILAVFVLKFVLHSKRMLSMFMFYLFTVGIFYVASLLDLPLSKEVF